MLLEKTIILLYINIISAGLINFLQNLAKKGMKYARFCTVYDKTTKRLPTW